MYNFDTAFAVEIAEKDALSTRNQSRIVLPSPCVEKRADYLTDDLMNENEDIISINSLFGKDKVELKRKPLGFAFEIVKCKKQKNILKCVSKKIDQKNFLKNQLDPEFIWTFPPLVSILKNIFSQGKFEKYDELSELQLKVLLIILRRKFGRKEITSKKDRESLLKEVEFIEKNFANCSSKRTEENNKFIFKRTLKMLKEMFKKDINLFSNQENSEQNINSCETVVDFRKRFKKFSSLSLKTLNDLLKDKLFNDNFKKLLIEPSVEQSIFVKSYLSSLNSKLEKLVQRWQKLLCKGCDPDEVEKAISSYFLTNNQCKLPWSYYEVISAIHCFADSLDWFVQPNV